MSECQYASSHTYGIVCTVCGWNVSLGTVNSASTECMCPREVDAFGQQVVNVLCPQHGGPVQCAHSHMYGTVCTQCGWCGVCGGPHTSHLQRWAQGGTETKQDKARLFNLVREQDITGISGTGIVAEGVEFSDGTTVLRWLKAGTARPDKVKPTTVIHESAESVEALHGHNGATRIVWLP